MIEGIKMNIKQLCGLTLLAACSQAFAGDATTTFNVSANLNAVCLVSADPLSFGNYDPIDSTDTTANTNLYVTCSDTTPYSVYLEAGLHSSSNVLNRNMLGSNSGGLLAYQLYTTSTTSGPIWGDGTVGTDYQCGIGTGSQDTFIVYGVIPAGQTFAPDDISYTDVMTVNVTY
jgi:spore coat protein U-like protein